MHEQSRHFFDLRYFCITKYKSLSMLCHLPLKWIFIAQVYNLHHKFLRPKANKHTSFLLGYKQNLNIYLQLHHILNTNVEIGLADEKKKENEENS